MICLIVLLLAENTATHHEESFPGWVFTEKKRLYHHRHQPQSCYESQLDSKIYSKIKQNYYPHLVPCVVLSSVCCFGTDWSGFYLFIYLNFAIRLGHHNSLRQLLWAHRVQTLRVVTARDLFTSSVVLLRPPGIRYRSVGRLGQRLNVPTQGRRVAQTGTRPFSLTTLGCGIPIQESNPGRICGVLPVRMKWEDTPGKRNFFSYGEESYWRKGFWKKFGGRANFEKFTAVWVRYFIAR